jgi:hypothetical protein
MLHFTHRSEHGEQRATDHDQRRANEQRKIQRCNVRVTISQIIGSQIAEHCAREISNAKNKEARCVRVHSDE